MDSIFSPINTEGDIRSPLANEKICIISSTDNYMDIAATAQKFKLPVIFRSVWNDSMYDDNMVFILEEFEGPVFEKLKRRKTILGPTALSQIDALPAKPIRPLFCLILYKKKICISGFEPFSLSHLKNLTNFMGGSVRPEVRDDISYVVVSSSRDPQYKKAAVLGIPVVEQQWLMELWSHRHDSTFKAEDTYKKYKLPVFAGCHFFFHGFSGQELVEVEEKSKMHGAVLGSSAQQLTHVIVNDSEAIKELKKVYPVATVVRREWFFGSLDSGFPVPEEKHFCENPEKANKMALRRKQQSFELYDTEKSYIEILRAIIMLFKVPLEEAHLNGASLISPADIEIIFGRLTPIYEVHAAIADDLQPLVENWNDCSCLGAVFVKHNANLKKVYPPFVNFQEASRRNIEECESSNPKFQAFLRRVELDPLCRRQGLKDLLSWPVQRIGRLILLLQGILKDTFPSNPDHPTLKEAIEALEACGKEVNEDKRKMDVYISTLDAYNDIENGPSELLQNRRYLVEKVSVHEVSESGKISDQERVLFLFRGYLEICKVRKVQAHTPTISRSGGGNASSLAKKYKHLLLYPVEWISHVIYIVQPSEHMDKFALAFQPPTGKHWRTIYQLAEKHRNLERILDSFAAVVAKCKLQKTMQVKQYMTYSNVQHYFKSSVIAAGNEEKYTLPPSPGGRSLDSELSPRKSFLRRAVSTILTPFSSNSGNLLAPESRTCSSSSINSIGAVSLNLGETPKVKKKLKSNSFGSKTLFWNR